MEEEVLVLLDLGVEILHTAGRTYVDVEEMYLCLRVSLADIGGLLHRGQAADRGAIGEVVLIPGAGALHEADLRNLAAVGRAHDLALGGTILRRVPLHQDVSDDVRVPAEAEVLDLGRIVWFPAGRPDDGADSRGDRPFLHVQVDGAVRAGLCTSLHAVVADMLRIDYVAVRIAHEMRQVDGLGLVEAMVEIVVALDFAHLLTVAAAGALFVYVTRVQRYLDLVISGRARNALDFSECQDSAALHEDDLLAELGSLDCSSHPRYAAADDQRFGL